MIAMLILSRRTNVGKANPCEQNILVGIATFELKIKRAAIANHFDVDEFTYVEQHGFS